MNNYKIKLKYILPTFLVVVFGTTLLYLLFRWFFTIQTHLLLINENVLDFWLPGILPFIPITIWLRPKLRILKLKDEDNRFLYQVIAWGTVTCVMITSNYYLKTATGKLTTVQNIESLTLPYNRYVSIQNIALNQQRSSFHVDVRLGSGENPDLNFNAYVVFPFKASRSQNKFKYWYGLHFQDHINNASSSVAKEKKYEAFVQKINKDLQQYQFSSPQYYTVLQPSDDQQYFIKAIQKLKVKAPTDSLVIITPEKGRYAERSGTSLPWIFGSLAIGLLVFMLALIFADYDPKEHQRQLKGVQAQSDDLVEMLTYLIPRNGHFVSAILIDLNLLVFLVMIFSGEHVLSPSASELMPWGANHRPSVLQGEWWRLITSMFVHGGILHLLFNIYGFVIAAIFIESVFTRFNYFLLYLLSGIGGSLASIFWYENTASVGASGAIFGLYGALLSLLLTNAFGKYERQEVWLFIGPYAGINLLFGMFGNIDNAAHIGGLLSGAFFGLVLYKFGNKKVYKKPLGAYAKSHKGFRFKGHTYLYEVPEGICKLVISLTQDTKSTIYQEYVYEEGKLMKHIDYINHQVLKCLYDQDKNLIEQCFLSFNKQPDKASLEVYKRFDYTKNKLIKETFYWVVAQTKHLQYEATKTYAGDLLIQDEYHSLEETYTITQSYDTEGNLKEVLYNEGERKHILKYDNEGYLIELIVLEPKQTYSKQTFSYQQGRLHKTIEYSYLALETMQNNEEADAIIEYEYWYNAQGLVTKEIITDVLHQQVLSEFVYNYERL
ncbi:rhomboid family intramembrane serine protease [uncultured Microscilla sp.]|uniref:rhomboid family intramembrane serine protease n=1 Tax=uncultured Microscilla sp. TaxID=432653 RepID=UPI00260F9018|nr:rhomboid family intramembrane serine protease [uncultured Microscilla sp.]